MSTDPSLEVPKETIIGLLKDKGREMQKIQKKLDKLQEKYVQTYKDQKLILKDREVLEKIVSTFLNEEPHLFSQKQQYGQYDMNELIELSQKREDEKQKSLTNLIAATNKEKCELEEKYKAMMEKQVKGMDSQTQQLVKQLKFQIQDLEQNNSRLAKEIIELNDIIQMKNHEILELRKVEEDYANYKTQLLMREMQQQSQIIQEKTDINRRLQQSDFMNEQLRLQNKIENLMDENRQLKSKLNNIQKDYEQLKNLYELEQQAKKQSPQMRQQSSANSDICQNIQNVLGDYEINPFEGDIQKNSQKNSSSVTKVSKNIQTDDEPMITIDINRQPSDEQINQEYLKNVIFKYFLYQETKNYKEAQMLRHAIMTILKMSHEERRMIEDPKKGTMWSYLTDNVFCYKQGLNLNDSRLMTQQMNQSVFMK